tara:strand:- start:415 stop:759 length:345 start_codon:yes stop_codon:yes gene_type:complete
MKLNIEDYRNSLSDWIRGKRNEISLSKRDIVEDQIPGDSSALFADGFDDAIIGYQYIRWGEGSGDYRVVYDSEKMIECLVSRDGMSYEVAVEFLEFNTWGAYMGEFTPVFISTI